MHMDRSTSISRLRSTTVSSLCRHSWS